MKKKIMFVCLGNICRSPLAEIIFKSIIEKSQKRNEYFINSSGTGNWHIGDLADSRSRLVAKKHGLIITHRAIQFNSSFFAKYDYIFTMDKKNYHHLSKMTSDKKHLEKVKMFREFDTIKDNIEVPDPYHGNDKEFELTYQICERNDKEIFKWIERYH